MEDNNVNIKPTIEIKYTFVAYKSQEEADAAKKLREEAQVKKIAENKK